MSQYVSESNAPPFLRDQVQKVTEEEFRCYAAVINDRATPARGLEVITNDARAVRY